MSRVRLVVALLCFFALLLFSLLLLIQLFVRKSDNYIVIAIVGRAITLERKIKGRSKEIIAKIKQRKLRVITIVSIF